MPNRYTFSIPYAYAHTTKRFKNHVFQLQSWARGPKYKRLHFHDDLNNNLTSHSHHCFSRPKRESRPRQEAWSGLRLPSLPNLFSTPSQLNVFHSLPFSSAFPRDYQYKISPTPFYPQLIIQHLPYIHLLSPSIHPKAPSPPLPSPKVSENPITNPKSNYKPKLKAKTNLSITITQSINISGLVNEMDKIEWDIYILP